MNIDVLILSLGVEIFDPEVPQKVLIMSRYLDKSPKSRQISTNLNNLDRLDENLDAAKSRLKSLDFKNLDREKKAGLYTKDSLDLDLNWSRLSRPPGLLDPLQVDHSKTNALVFSLLK